MKKVGSCPPEDGSAILLAEKFEVRRQKNNNPLFVRFSSNFQLRTSNSICRYKLLTAGFLLTMQYANPVYACAVCFGNKDSLQTKGTMAGVFFLLIVITAVLAGFAVTFIRWGLRERALQESLGPASSEPGHS